MKKDYWRWIAFWILWIVDIEFVDIIYLCLSLFEFLNALVVFFFLECIGVKIVGAAMRSCKCAWKAFFIKAMYKCGFFLYHETGVFDIERMFFNCSWEWFTFLSSCFGRIVESGLEGIGKSISRLKSLSNFSVSSISRLTVL